MASRRTGSGYNTGSVGGVSKRCSVCKLISNVKLSLNVKAGLNQDLHGNLIIRNLENSNAESNVLCAPVVTPDAALLRRYCSKRAALINILCIRNPNLWKQASSRIILICGLPAKL